MKKFIIGLAVAMAATLSQASYLYWQVSGNGTDSATFNGNTISGYRVVALTDSYSTTPGVDYSANVLTSYYANDAGTGYAETSIANPNIATGGNAYAYFDSATTSSCTFYVEVMGYNNTVVIGISEALSYSSNVTNGHVINASTLDELSSMASSAGVSAWTGGAYAAPEPTSGLLLLVGGALLALRRRRA